MKILLLFLQFNLLFLITYAQESTLIVNEFSIIKKNELFATKKENTIYTVSTLKSVQQHSNNKSIIDSMLYNAAPYSIIGPVMAENHSSIYLIKTVETRFSMRAGQILISPIKYSENEINKIAEEIILHADKTQSFDSFCKKYSEDKYNNKSECDLGWFKSGVMVKEFEEAVLLHKRGDIFRVKTIFGTHIVKVIEEAIEEDRVVNYLEIKIKK